MSAPDRGDLVMLNLNPQRGREQAKRRPVLVISPARFNEVFGIAFVAPITSRGCRNDFEVALPDDVEVHGSVLVHQLKALDWQARAPKHLGRAPMALVHRVADIIKEIVS